MVSSVIWTDEEAKYVKAMLSWDPKKADTKKKTQPKEQKPIRGELRVLVVGAKGTGKTCVMQRFCKNSFPTTPDPFYERGGRHTIEIDGEVFLIDALEMASKHLTSDAFLTQAIAITEAAVLLYDVTSPDSFRLAQGIFDFIRENRGGRDYGVLLVGNKSDVDDEVRQVPWAEGRKAATNLSLLGGGGSRLMMGKDVSGFNRRLSSRVGSSGGNMGPGADGMAAGIGMGGATGKQAFGFASISPVMDMKMEIAAQQQQRSGKGRSMSVNEGPGTGRLVAGPGRRVANSITGASKTNTPSISVNGSPRIGNIPEIVNDGSSTPHLAHSDAVDVAAVVTRDIIPGFGNIPIRDSSITTATTTTTATTGPATATTTATAGTAATAASIGMAVSTAETTSEMGGPVAQPSQRPHSKRSNKSPTPPLHAPPPPPLSLPHSNGATAQAIASPRIISTVSFLECSARSGENIQAVFEHLGREVLRLRQVNRERKEREERAVLGARMGGKGRDGGSSILTGGSGRKGRGIWKTLTTPWFKREGVMSGAM